MDWKEKYRPLIREDFVGNKAVLDTFFLDITKEESPRAYLITGPHGIGKTSAALAGLRAKGVHEMNITVLDASAEGGVDQARDMIADCMIYTSHPRGWVIDEAHSTSKKFQEAILKTSENGSSMDTFIFCTTEVEKIAAPLRSRCNPYPLKAVPDLAIKKRLKNICRKEDILINPEVMELILERADGCVRDAVKLLQAVVGREDEDSIEYLKEVAPGGVEKSPQAIELIRALYSSGTKKVMSLLKEIRKDKSEEPESLRRFALSYGATVLLNSGDIEIAAVMENFEDPYFDIGDAWNRFILDCYRATLKK